MIYYLMVLSVFTIRVSISAGNSSSMAGDVFLNQNQRECFVQRNIGSCVKYKAAKFIRKLATNSFGYFPSENSRDLGDSKTIRLVHLEVPSELQLLSEDSRSLKDDNELTKTFKFLKRTAELFSRTHGLQFEISSESGTRISSNEDAIVEPRSRSRISRNDRKRRKWLIILPLVILMKIAHLKMIVVPLLLATLGLNAILIAGGGWIIHYLKYKTLCKIHPHFVQTQSHVYESDPNEYSSFLGSSSGGHTAGGYYSSQDPGPYDKNWNTRKNFHAYGG